jgi:hypothetical protein
MRSAYAKVRVTSGTIAVALAGMLSLASLSPASAQTLTWKITPNPTITGNAELNDVSCPSASFCVAAGLTGDPVHPLIESWNGKAWSIVSTPSAPYAEFWSVSCRSGGFCVAVGFTTLSNGDTTPLAESWNGTKWSIMSTPTGSSGELVGVSCASASMCSAVGSQANGEGGTENFAETWNGSAWSIASTPPYLGGDVGDLLNGVSCPSSSYCVADGEYGFVPMYPLIESWNGTKWSIMTSPAKSNGSLTEVSCASVSSCVAAGTYMDSDGNNHLYAQSWNGKSWSATPAATPEYAEFNDVACVSATDCTGAGFYWPPKDAAIQSQVWSWNGKSWSQVTTPSPSTAKPNQLFGVACSSARSCTAVGIIAPYGTNNTSNLIETGNAGT